MPPAGSDEPNGANSRGSGGDRSEQRTGRSERPDAKRESGNSSRPPDRQSGEDSDGSDDRASDHTDDGSDDRASDRTDDGSDSEGPSTVHQQRSFLLDCLQDSQQARQRLPYVLQLLETDEKSVRVLAATTCCLVAVETDDTELVEYLVRRLSDRLSEEDVSLELTTALDYLSSEYSEYVSELLAEMALEEEEDDVPLPEVGNFTRNYYYGYEPERDGVGRLRIAGEDTEENPYETVGDRQREEREQTEYERQREPSPDEETEDEEESAGGPAQGVERTTEVSTIAVRSQFDELHIRGQRRSGRYATAYEALVQRRGRRRAVELRLVDQPESTSDIPVFEEEISGYLQRWQSIGDHDHIVTVLDWGSEPRPWLATTLARETVAEREDIDFVTGLGNALDIVDAVSTAHQSDIVHGGLDPTNVVYPSDTFEDVTDQALLLDNVGLLQVFRHYFNPAEYLDPRYAAPEYYSDRFGRIDHATDIYQLGAVFYRLFTNQPPHTGDFTTIRGSVLTSDPDPPSTVADDVPEAVDDLVSKAMAKQKIRRYETVEHLHQELASIADDYEYV